MKRIFAIICLTALLVTGCSAQSGSSQSTDSQSSSSSTVLYGKVTSISGKELTIQLAAANAGAPGNSSRNGTEKFTGKKPDGSAASGSVRSRPNGNGASGAPRQGGGTRAAMAFTGEKKTITISDQSVISTQSKGSTSSATLSEIKAGTVLKVTMDEDAVTTVEIMQSSGGVKSAPSSSSSK